MPPLMVVVACPARSTVAPLSFKAVSAPASTVGAASLRAASLFTVSSPTACTDSLPSLPRLTFDLP